MVKRFFALILMALILTTTVSFAEDSIDLIGGYYVVGKDIEPGGYLAFHPEEDVDMKGVYPGIRIYKNLDEYLTVLDRNPVHRVSYVLEDDAKYHLVVEDGNVVEVNLYYAKKITLEKDK